MNLSQAYFDDSPQTQTDLPRGEPGGVPPAQAFPGQASQAAMRGPDKVINSLVEILRREAEMLADRDGDFDASITRQKLQLMMQLNQLSPRPENLNEESRHRLTEASRLLQQNASILKRRMTAIREIAGMISQEINEAQSDGTYAVSAAARGYARL